MSSCIVDQQLCVVARDTSTTADNTTSAFSTFRTLPSRSDSNTMDQLPEEKKVNNPDLETDVTHALDVLKTHPVPPMYCQAPQDLALSREDTSILSYIHEREQQEVIAEHTLSAQDDAEEEEEEDDEADRSDFDVSSQYPYVSDSESDICSSDSENHSGDDEDDRDEWDDAGRSMHDGAIYPHRTRRRSLRRVPRGATAAGALRSARQNDKDTAANRTKEFRSMYKRVSTHPLFPYLSHADVYAMLGRKRHRGRPKDSELSVLEQLKLKPKPAVGEVYPREYREKLIKYFHWKRQHRNFERVVYECRHHFAVGRKRVNGRFVKESDEVEEEETKSHGSPEPKNTVVETQKQTVSAQKRSRKAVSADTTTDTAVEATRSRVLKKHRRGGVANSSATQVSSPVRVDGCDEEAEPLPCPVASPSTLSFTQTPCTFTEPDFTEKRDQSSAYQQGTPSGHTDLSSVRQSPLDWPAFPWQFGDPSSKQQPDGQQGAKEVPNSKNQETFQWIDVGTGCAVFGSVPPHVEQQSWQWLERL